MSRKGMQVTTTEVLGLTPQGTHVKGISRREAEKAGSEREEENQESLKEKCPTHQMWLKR